MKGFSSGTIHGSSEFERQHGLLFVQDVRVPQENNGGEEGEAFKIDDVALEQCRYQVAAGATGVIRASRTASVAYANVPRRLVRSRKVTTRETEIAEMEVADYQMSHLLWLQRGYLKNQGRRMRARRVWRSWQATTSQRKGSFRWPSRYMAPTVIHTTTVERYLRNCKAATHYGRDRDIHTLMHGLGAWLKKRSPRAGACRDGNPQKRGVSSKEHTARDHRTRGRLLVI